jgi:hypothetical protein
MSEMLKPALPDHETVHRETVERIVAELRPVRRLWPLSLRLATWAILEVAVLLLVLHSTSRTDLTQQMRNPWYLLSVGGFVLAGALGAALALRSAIPGREPRTAESALLIVLAFSSALLSLHLPFKGNLLVTTFVKEGLPCVHGIVMLAAIPWFALLWAVRRGVPLSAGLAGALVGAAAFLSSFALMRIKCPIDEGAHLLVWHLLPALIGVALSAWAGILLFKRRNNLYRTQVR